MSWRKAVFGGLFFLSLMANKSAAADTGQSCKDVTMDRDRFTVCEFSAEDADIRLFWGEGATPYRHFETLFKALEAKNKRLVFAMNAGMYHPDRSPVGLYVDQQGPRGKLQTNSSSGNFGMLPNGVFYKSANGIAVRETKAFEAAAHSPEFATQSGPMLVIENQLHPRFNKGSKSKRIRNGVGVSADGQTVYFAMSDRPVNFYRFASLFKDRLHTPNALYLDGVISRLFDASSGRRDFGAAMGPIVAVVDSDELSVVSGDKE